MTCIFFLHTLIKYNSKTSKYTTYNTTFTNTSLQYLSNAYLPKYYEKKKKKKKGFHVQPNTYSSKKHTSKTDYGLGSEPMHKYHFLLNLSMLLAFTHIIFSVSYLIFAFSLRAFITGGDRFLLQSHT